MPVQTRRKCPSCQQPLKVADTLVGQNVRCPSCRHRFIVSSMEETIHESTTVSVEVNDSSSSGSGGGDAGVSAKSHHPSHDEPTIGKVGRFDLKELVGQGSFGEVYRVYDPQLDRQIALKIPKFGPKDKKKIRRFLAEARAAASLRHPNIVAVYERGRASGQYYIASEFVQGETVSDWIEDQLPDFRKAALWIRDLALALDYAHSEKVIHRDIKSDNIMLGPNQRPQIMDFGLAKRLDEDSSMTADGGLLGTPAYMSPEQARGDTKLVGPQSDQYSLGVVLYELLTGKRPFEGPPHSVIAKVTMEEPPAPQTINPEIPDDLQAICLKAISKSPSHRYASLTPMAEDLDNWLDGYETVARPIKAHERFIRWCRRNPLTAGLTTAFIVSLLMGVIATSYFAIAANRERTLVVEQRDRAERAQTDAEKAQRDAEKQQKLAEEQQAIAENASRLEAEQRQIATLRLAESYFSNAMNLWRDGLAVRALAMLIRCEEMAPLNAVDLRRAIRLNMAIIHPQLEQFRNFSYHERVVYASTFSPDGKRVATGANDGVVQIWDPVTGLRLLPPIQHSESPVRSVKFSPDGKMLATVCEAGTIKIWDSVSGELKATYQRPSRIGDMAFNSDGSLFATGEWSGQVQIWNTATGEPVGAPLQTKGGGRAVSSVEFSTDGRLLAAAGKLRIWNLENGQLIAKHPPLETTASRATFSPDGRTLAWTSIRDKIGRIWDIKAGKPVGKPIPDQELTRNIAFNSDSKWLMLSGDDGKIQVWGIAENEFLMSKTFPAFLTRTMSLSPDDQSVLVGDLSGRIQIWPTKNLQKHDDSKKFNNGSFSSATAFSPDGQLLATASSGNVRVWNTENGELLHTYDASVSFGGLKFSPNGIYLIGQCDNKFIVWKPGTAAMNAAIIEHPDGIHHAAFNSRGHRIVTAGTDNKLRVWNMSSGTLLAELDHRNSIYAVGFGPNWDHVLSISSQGQLTNWNYDKRQKIGEVMQIGEYPVWPVEISPDGNTLAISAASGRVTKLWNRNGETWSGPRVLPGWHTNKTSLFFSNDSQHLLVAGSHQMAISETATGKQVGKTIESPHPAVFTKWATAQKEFALSVTSQHEIQLWDMRSGKPVGIPLPTAAGSDAAITAQGDRFTTESENGTTQVWNIPEPLPGTTADLKLWTEVRTAMELTEDGNFRPLNHEEWYSRLQTLNERENSPAK